MPERSVIELVGILQQHGLAVGLLELWAQHCEQRRTGELALFTTDGRITSYKALICGKVQTLHKEPLTKV